MKPRNYSRIFRVLHWAIAITFLLLLLTIFLRKTWMEKNQVAEIIQTYLTENNYETLPQNDAIVLAKKIRKPMWVWHIYFGYVLVCLYCIRLALPFFGEMKFTSPFQKDINTKTKFHYWSYLIFYIFTAISLITGLLIEWGPKTIKKPLEEIHELSIYYLLTFIVIHFSGVLWAEFSNQKGIISRIISGSKNEN
jgi:cytochrome b561